MYATLAIANPLPEILNQPAENSAHRRRAIGQFQLDALNLERFNILLYRLGRTHIPLDCDRMATAARELINQHPAPTAPPCIREQMRRAIATACMLADRGWKPVREAAGIARLMLEYVRGHDDLIPDQLPTIGRLDDALVVATAWPKIDTEMADYLDFCRLRAIEANLRGCNRRQFGFNRADWREAAEAEAALDAHQRRVRDSSYLSAPKTRFVVH